MEAPGVESAGSGGVAPEGEESPEDVLAGPVDDGVLQDLLTQSLPDRLGASDPAAAASPQANATVEAAWVALADDLAAGGWTQTHMQAHELSSEAAAATPGTLPREVTVIIMWSATSSAGEALDRQLSAVRMDTTKQGDDAVLAITTR